MIYWKISYTVSIDCVLNITENGRNRVLFFI